MKPKSICLFYKDNTSDKVYNVTLEEHGSDWIVNFQYGRRGSSLTSGTKTMSPMSYEAAKKIYDKLVVEKTGKGYVAEEGTAPFTVGTEESYDSGIRPQLLNSISEEEVEKYLTDDNWCAQEKYDGRNRLLISEGETQFGTNRKGLVVAISPEIQAELKKLGDTVMAGEDMGNYVMLFDLLDDKGLPYYYRWQYLHAKLNSQKKNSPLRLAHIAVGTADKRKLYKKLFKDNAEGIVFKNINAVYKPGRPNSGGDQLKFKFIETASVYVNQVNRTKRSVSICVLDDDSNGVEVGNVTVYPNQEIPKVGDVIEVQYLYYFPGGSLFQPVLLGQGNCVRDDIDLKACRLSQLKVKREEVDI